MGEVHQGLTRRDALKKGLVLGGATMAWAVPTTRAVAMSTTSAQETSAPSRGCTPGYWKNHPDAWVGASPDDSIFEHFFQSGDVVCEDIVSLVDMTMMQGLSFGGGPRIVGATKILLRAAIAAYLNASHPEIASNYYMSNMIAEVRTVLLNPIDACDLDRDAILDLAGIFDRANNAGCTLN